MKNQNVALGLFTGGSVFFIMIVVYGYQVFFSPNIALNKKSQIFIPENATIHQVVDSLKKYNQLEEIVSFMFVAKVLGYQENIKSGRYILEEAMSNIDAVRHLRSGNQTAVKVTFNSVRMKEELAKKITKTLSITEKALLTQIKDVKVAESYGFNADNFGVMFLPNTYNMYWTSDSKNVLDRLHREYKGFWNAKRTAQATALGLTPIEVSILASIVEAETRMNDEKPRVAGVYLNRLKKGMLLQADPTVVFSVGDFTLKRVLNKHLAVDSPYNTYKYKGLPPGPIRIPSSRSIAAVLNAEKHDYIFFCAKEDFSGYHSFAKTSREHSRNARKYRTALNKRKIR